VGGFWVKMKTVNGHPRITKKTGNGNSNYTPKKPPKKQKKKQQKHIEVTSPNGPHRQTRPSTTANHHQPHERGEVPPMPLLDSKNCSEAKGT
jgi:hypothetical protein